MGITLVEALKDTVSFLFGSNKSDTLPASDHQNTNLPKPDDNATEDTLLDKETKEVVLNCPNCGNKLRTIYTSNTDFINICIYSCPECKMMCEYQFDKDMNLCKQINIYNPIKSDEAVYAENMGHVDIAEFALGRLWSVCGDLCYPANIKADFPETNKSTKVFIKIKSSDKKRLEGYIINEQNMVGELKLSDNQTVSMFFNPYLASLPRVDFSYLAIPTTFCESLESVLTIRFNHDIEIISSEVTIHRLNIIQDCIIRCLGIELYVRYVTHGIPPEEKLTHTFKKIGLKNIVMGKDLAVSDGYAIQLYSLTRHTLSAKTKSNVSESERVSFYEAVIEFFKIFDKTNV
jgi:predicted RNA-binding Zn-ribbon protein involved in translation (DUF1610 family)